MASIVPLFDFEPFAVPTRETLRRQALSLSITGVGLNELDSALSAILKGNASGASGALIPGATPVGTLWSDPAGELWVQEQSGPVRLHRYGGGYESRRYYIRDIGGVGERPPGAPVRGRQPGSGFLENHERTELTQGAPAAEEAGLSATRESMDETDAATCQGFMADSNTTGYRRWVGRGLCALHPIFPTPGGTFLTVAEIRLGLSIGAPISTNNWQWDLLSDGGTLPQERWIMPALVPAATASTVSAVNGNHTFKTNFIGWALGGQQWSEL